MAAALSARRRNGNADVVLFEQHQRVGKKIMRTGNGRCNIMNAGATRGKYNGDAAFAEAVLRCVGKGEPRGFLFNFFESMGLLLREEDEGRIYPASQHAGSVVDMLRFHLDALGVSVRTGETVTGITKDGGRFTVATREGYRLNNVFDKVIVATGGAAGIGQNEATGYDLLREMGHSVSELRPGLTRVSAPVESVTGLKGVRLHCSVKLMNGNVAEREETGEIIFSESGVSGIPIMNMSRHVKNGMCLSIDTVPDIPLAKLSGIMGSAAQTLPLAEHVTRGVAHPRIARAILAYCGYSANAPSDEVDFHTIASSMKNWSIPAIRVGNMLADAQVTAGGAACREFMENTLESRVVKGLHAAGEILDVDGECGGFNLMFALASGILAGRAACTE